MRLSMLRSGILAAMTPLLGACASQPNGPYAPTDSAARSSITAERLTQSAVAAIESDSVKAEALLREALTADLFHGPAHNNLGVLYLQEGRLYEAANEFEWARKLMPGHPDPRLNLAMTLERAGRVTDAVASYDAALEIAPEHVPTMQGLARCQIRYDRVDDRTLGLLQHLALHGETEVWRAWSREQLIRLGP